MALTHSSHSGTTTNNHSGTTTNNERLEFLGDAVLELIISEYLYKYNKLSEGKMTKIRSNIVCAESLSQAASDLNLGDYMLLGKGEIVTGGRKRKSNLANAFEAVMGAVFLDSDYDTTKKVVLGTLEKNIELALSGGLIKDYKTELQEQIQKHSDNAIEYVLEKSEGPEHNKTFFIASRITKPSFRSRSRSTVTTPSSMCWKNPRGRSTTRPFSSTFPLTAWS